MTLRGAVPEFSLDVILRFLADAGTTGTIELRGERFAGTASVRSGRIVDARCGEDDGEAALGLLFAEEAGEFEFTPGDVAGEGTISGETGEVIARAREERDRVVAIRAVIPRDDMVFTLSERAATRSRIELSSDQWRTLLSVNGTRDVAAVAQALGVRRRVARELLAGLVGAGAVDAAAVPEQRSALPPLGAPPPAPEAWGEPAAAAEPAAERAADTWPAPAAQPRSETWPAAEEGWSEPAAPAWTEWESPSIAAPGEAEPAAQAPASGSAPETWGTPAAPDAQAAPRVEDDRLAAIFGTAAPAAAEPAESAPAPIEPPQGIPASAETVVLPPVADLVAPAPQAEPEFPVVERRRGGFFGFGRREAAPVAPPAQSARARTKVGKLAAFANALVAEYGSGRYGKGRIESKMSNLLLRVDEQADPVDRPFPLAGDLLAVAALDEGVLAEGQAVPYLALLISQIHADAERAFGRDKARQGYRAAREAALGADPLLESADLASALPRA